MGVKVDQDQPGDQPGDPEIYRLLSCSHSGAGSHRLLESVPETMDEEPETCSDLIIQDPPPPPQTPLRGGGGRTEGRAAQTRERIHTMAGNQTLHLSAAARDEEASVGDPSGQF